MYSLDGDDLTSLQMVHRVQEIANKTNRNVSFGSDKTHEGEFLTVVRAAQNFHQVRVLTLLDIAQ